MTDLVIVGAGGHGREAVSVARAAKRAGSADWNVIGFVDDGASDGSVDTELVKRLGTRLLGGISLLEQSSPVDRGSAHMAAAHVIAVGDSRARQAIEARIDPGRVAAVLVDPTAWIGEDVELGPGAMLYPGSCCTTNVRIGRHTHLNCGVTVSHDCRVGDHVSLSPGVLLNGEVTIGDGAFLGTGAVVLPGRHVGVGAVVAAGAVVTTDVAPGVTVAGVPARRLH